MSRLFYHVMQDNAGNLLFDVSGTMRIAGSGTLATIYGDEALTVILPNPMTNHPSFGSFKCFLGAGDYDFYMAKSGYTFETLAGVQGHGTMAQQDASTVAITGGSAHNLTGVGIGTAAVYPLDVVGGIRGGTLGLNTPPGGGLVQSLFYNRVTEHGLLVRGLTADAGGYHVIFQNASGTNVGAISTTATTTSYGTTSDVRLKHAITPLTGAPAVVQALRPVAFRWRSDDSPGHGFLASEVAQVVDGVITGDADAMNEDGSVRPQMIDHSKLVPWLTAALQETLAQVQALTARVATLEDGLGV